MTMPPRRTAVAAVVAVVAAAASLTGCAHTAQPPPASAPPAAPSTASPDPIRYPVPGRSVSPPWGLSSMPRPVPAGSRSTPGPKVRSLRVAGPTAVTASTANAAALAGVVAIESADTTADANPHDTVQRAVAWLTPAFAVQVKAFPPVAAPGASWDTWAAHRAYVVVTTRLGGDEHPSDTAATAYRQVIAVLHPTGRDGWHGRSVTELVSVSLVKAAGQWRLASSQSS